MATETPRLDDLIDHIIGLEPTGSPLDHLSQAMQVSERLGEVADHLIGHFVDQARRSGASWTEIGTYMGVTKQAAQKRFAPKSGDVDRLIAAGRFSRFTPRLRNAVLAAEELARANMNAAVRSSHVVVAMVSDPENLGSRALAAQGVSFDDVREAAAGVLGPKVDAVPLHIPFAAEAKELLQTALSEALQLGHNYLGAEHLLLALLSQPESTGGQALARCGVDKAAAEVWIRATLDQQHPLDQRPPPDQGSS
jgi:hypothetical protein